MHTLVIIPISLLDAANTAAVAVFEQPGPQFVPALSADGSEPATHAWLSAPFRPEFRTLLTQMTQLEQWVGTIVIDWEPSSQSADDIVLDYNLKKVVFDETFL